MKGSSVREASPISMPVIKYRICSLQMPSLVRLVNAVLCNQHQASPAGPRQIQKAKTLVCIFLPIRAFEAFLHTWFLLAWQRQVAGGPPICGGVVQNTVLQSMPSYELPAISHRSSLFITPKSGYAPSSCSAIPEVCCRGVTFQVSVRLNHAL